MENNICTKCGSKVESNPCNVCESRAFGEANSFSFLAENESQDEGMPWVDGWEPWSEYTDRPLI